MLMIWLVVDGILGSDTNAVYFIIEGKMKRVRKRKRTIYNFNKADWDLYDDLLSKVQWNSSFKYSSIVEIWCSFKETDLCKGQVSRFRNDKVVTGSL